MDNKVIEKVIEIANAIETMQNKKYYTPIEATSMILELTKDGITEDIIITGYINVSFLSLFESKKENLGYLKLRKRNDVWKILEPTNGSYPRVRDEYILEYRGKNLILGKTRSHIIKPLSSCR